MSRARFLIYDDTVEVPAGIHGLLGLDRFSRLISARRRLVEHATDAARQAGFTRVLHLATAADRQALTEELARTGSPRRAVYLSADVLHPDPVHFALVLEKLAFAESDVFIAPDGVGPAHEVDNLGLDTLRGLIGAASEAERRAGWIERQRTVESLPTEGMLGLSDATALTQFLAGAFQTRAFNRIDVAGRTIRKWSTDRDKMRREHDYWGLLPPRLQRWFVQPFEYEEDRDGASYCMERLGLTDFAVLWIHGAEAVSDGTFAGFLDAVFGWFEERPSRPTPPERARQLAEAAYRTKVLERVERLHALPVGAQLDRLLASGTAAGGLRPLVDRYLALLEAEWASRPPIEPSAIVHGDLCFSNILFDKRSGLLRLIDPRGASTADEIWGDPHYDLAKLSHSALGGYDFINHGLFDVAVGEDLRLELRLDRPPPGPREALFIERVRAAGFDPVRVRLYEASLFLSMLPLHVEKPRKLAAFALAASGILDEVERGRAIG